MKKEIKKGILFFVFILLSILVGCTGQSATNEIESTYKVYFFNRTENAFIEEEAEIILEEDFVSSEDIIEKLIERVLKGSQNTSLSANAFSEIEHIQASLREQMLSIQLDESYKTLDVETQLALRSSLVYTLTALEFVEAVEFTIGETPLMNTSGIKIGPITREDILIGPLDPNPPTSTQTITLYFGKAESEFLYPEKREIQVNNSIPVEQYIVEQLLIGPTSPELISLLPTDTVINDIKTQDRVCQIDISYNLGVRTPTATSQEELIVYSIINSLTESSRIDKVVFLKDGKKQTDGNADLRRDESLIAKDE